MKKFSGTLLLALGIVLQGFSANAQDSSFTINGRFEKVKSGTIFLTIFQKEKTIRDTAKIKNGLFQFHGHASTPSLASLTLSDKEGYFNFYVEPARMTISGSGDSLKLLSIKGSPVNADDKILKEKMKPIKDWEEANNKIYSQAVMDKNTAVLDSLDEVDNEVLAAKRKIVSAFVKEHPNSLRSAMAIMENYAYYAEASDVEPLYHALSPKIKNAPTGREIKKMIAVYQRVAVGKLAPDITQLQPDSVPFSLSSLKGNYVLIDFWASWCGPCRRENPNVVAAYKQFKDKGFTVLGVSYDTKKDPWVKAIETDNLQWHQISDLKGWKNATSAEYGIKAIPSNVLVDRNGIIVAKNVFGKKLIEKLEEELK